jgi:hypothetical protein
LIKFFIKKRASWLKNIGLSDYIKNFEENGITGKNILDITQDEL